MKCHAFHFGNSEEDKPDAVMLVKDVVGSGFFGYCRECMDAIHGRRGSVWGELMVVVDDED